MLGRGHARVLGEMDAGYKWRRANVITRDMVLTDASTAMLRNIDPEEDWLFQLLWMRSMIGMSASLFRIDNPLLDLQFHMEAVADTALNVCDECK